MANYYTHKIKNGDPSFTFEEFFKQFLPWDADDILNDKVEIIENYDYYLNKIKASEKIIEEFQHCDLDKANRDAEFYFRQQLESHKERETRNAPIRQRYQSMMAKVQAWYPPLGDVFDLYNRLLKIKEEMIKELQTAIDFDCQKSSGPTLMTGTEWIQFNIENEQWNLTYYKEKNKKEIEDVRQAREELKSLKHILQSFNKHNSMDTTTQPTQTAFDLEQEIENAVTGFVTTNTSFSKHDITTAVRRANPGANVPHDDVKKIVQNIMDTKYSNWDRNSNGSYYTFNPPSDSDNDVDDKSANVALDSTLDGIDTTRVGD
jgi:hypothetical protein